MNTDLIELLTAGFGLPNWEPAKKNSPVSLFSGTAVGAGSESKS
jgi:hypothetical protein